MIKHKYQTVYACLKNEIEAGQYELGRRFLSEQEVSTRFKISRLTAVKILNMLASDRLLMRSQGKGTFVSYAPNMPLNPGDTVAFVMQTLKYYSKIVEHINNRCHETGLNFKQYIGPFNHEREYLQFDDPACRRAIFSPSWRTQDILEVYPRTLKPYENKVVLLGKKIKGYGGYSVFIDEVEAGRQSALHLINQGRKAIGFFSAFKEFHYVDLRAKGMAAACSEKGAGFWPLMGSLDIDDLAVIKAWALENRLDAIITDNPQVAARLVRALRILGFPAGLDAMPVLVFHDDGNADFLDFPLLYIERSSEKFADLLFRCLQAEPGLPKENPIPFRVISTKASSPALLVEASMI